jgi:hypothetical protein
LVVLGGIALSLIPPAETRNASVFEFKLIGCTAAAVLIGLALYFRGARAKRAQSRAL